MTAAATSLKARRTLPEIFADFPALAAAWDRGRLLRDVARMAAAAMSPSEAAQALDLSEAVFRDRLETDAEIRDAWNSARIDTIVATRTALVAAAQAGKAAAITPVLAALRREIAHPRIDFRALTVNQATEATGYTRQTIHAWRTKHGAPSNADGSISLPDLIAWRENWLATRTAGASGRPAPVNRFQDVKTRKLEIELAAAEGNLLDRGEVVAGLLARHQALVSAFRRRASELSVTLANQEPGRIRDSMETVFDDIRRQMLNVPSELRLPPPAAALFSELMSTLGPAGEAPA